MREFSSDEKLIAEAVLDARKVQDFIWGERAAGDDRIFNQKHWIELFQKRVDCIGKIDVTNPSSVVELRKRILQQAALSIRALLVLDKHNSIVKDRIY